MNKKERQKKRQETLKKFSVPGMPAYTKRKPNSIHISAANSKIHELAKCEICYDLLKMGCSFITEAHEKKTGLRRDIVCLDTGDIYEVDNSKTKHGRRHPSYIKVYWYDIKEWRVS